MQQLFSRIFKFCLQSTPDNAKLVASHPQYYGRKPKPIIAKHFDYSTREKGGQYFHGDWFFPKHESSLEDLISDLEKELTDEDEIEKLENDLEKANDSIGELKGGIEEAIETLESAEESTDWPAVISATEKLSKINDEN